MTWSHNTARLEIIPARAASGLAIRLNNLPATGRPMEFVWNGSSQGIILAFPGEAVHLEVEVTREPSVLEIRAGDNRPFVPGAIALIGSEVDEGG